MWTDFLNVEAVNQYTAVHPHLIYFLIALVSFSESLAILGVLVPGVVLMSFIGFLVGASVLPGNKVYFYLACGVVLGDLVSFGLGYLCRGKLDRLWPFTKWPSLLVNGERFFYKYGTKSICLGRFIGPLRAVLPMVAGALQMPLLKFLMVTVISGTAWAVIYTIPGWLLGALALELPPKLFAQLIFKLGILLLVVCLLIWLTRFGFGYVKRWWQRGVDFLWRKCSNFPYRSLILRNVQGERRALGIFLLLGILLGAFVWLAWTVLATDHRLLSHLNWMLCHLLASIRCPGLDRVMVAFTILGNLPFLLVFSFLVALWFVWYRKRRVAIFWALAVGVGGLATAGFKLFLYSPRPDMVMYGINSSSFPSGHVLLSGVIYGFLMVILARETGRRIFTWFGVILTVGIAFSRLYLGVHWLSDVLGSFLLAGILVGIITLFYDRERNVLDTPRFLRYLSITGGVWWLLNLLLGFESQLHKYMLVWPKQVSSFSYLINSQKGLGVSLSKEWPRYRINRLGMPSGLLNLVYVGDLEPIKSFLVTQGWLEQANYTNLRHLLKYCMDSNLNHYFSPLLPLYHGRKPSLILTKRIAERYMVVHLWVADIDFMDVDSPVWIGSIEEHSSLPNFLSFRRFAQLWQGGPYFQSAGAFIANELRGVFQTVELPLPSKTGDVENLWVVK